MPFNILVIIGDSHLHFFLMVKRECTYFSGSIRPTVIAQPDMATI